MYCVHLARGRDQWRGLVNTVANILHKWREISCPAELTLLQSIHSYLAKNTGYYDKHKICYAGKNDDLNTVKKRLKQFYFALSYLYSVAIYKYRFN